MFSTTWQLILTNCFLDISLCDVETFVNVVSHTLLRHATKNSSWNVIIVGFVVRKLYFLIQKKPKKVLLMILLACIQSKLTRSPTEMCQNAIISTSLVCPFMCRYSPCLLCCTAVGAIHYCTSCIGYTSVITIKLCLVALLRHRGMCWPLLSGGFPSSWG